MPNVPPNSPDDDQAAKPDASDNAIDIDKWLDAEIPNAWVAAYHSGRLLNQLWWHAQQHCLLNDLGQLRKVEEVFGKLVGVAFHVTSTSNSSLDTQIKSSLNRYHEHTTSEGVAEAWLACNEAIAEDQRDAEIAIADSWDPEGIWRQARENREWELERLVKTWAWPTVETLRRAFLSALPGDKDLAFELGRLVDQSVRRPDVYLSLWTAPPPTDELSGPIWPDTDGSNGESKSPEELADHGQGTDSPSGESDRASHNAESSPGADDTGSESDSPNRLANHSKEAGSLRPECGWGESTLQICRKLEVPAGRTKAIKELPLRPTREEFLSAVEKADAKLREYLGGIWWATADESPPDEFRYGPLVGQKKQLAKWILPEGADERGLATRVRLGDVWIRRNDRYSFEAWFKNSVKFEQARAKSESETSGS